MTEKLTTWSALPDEQLTTPVTGRVMKSEAPMFTEPQWIPNPAGGPPEPFGPNPYPDLAMLYDLPATLDVAGGVMGVEYVYQRVLRFHFAWASVWTNHEIVRSLALPVIDNDGEAWRIQKAAQLADAFRAANPNAYGVRVEWEGWDFNNPGIFGSHRDRVLGMRMFATGGASQLIGVDAGDQSPRPVQIEAELLYPPLDVSVPPPGISGTYAMPATTPASSTQSERSLALNQFAKIGEVAAGPEEQESFVPISDGVFDSQAAEVTHESQSWRKTRSMLAWVIPRSDLIRLDNYGLLVEIQPAVWVTSMFTPPRYRIRYQIDTTPIRQTTHRDDHLAGGAYQTWPPSKSEQQSNRTAGGYV